MATNASIQSLPAPKTGLFKYAFVNTVILIIAFGIIGIGLVWIIYVVTKVFEFRFEPIVQENKDGHKIPL